MSVQVRNIGLFSAIALVTAFSMQPAEAATPACTHGTALLQNDAQAWYSLQTQTTRLKTNITKLRNDIDAVIQMNDDIGNDDKTAKDIHKDLSSIAPLFELAPTIQSGLAKTARAAEIAHKDVLGPIHKVTNDIVTLAKLHEIKAELDAKVLPKLALFEKDAATAHLKSVTLTKDYIQACHIAATIQSKACIGSGNKAIDGVYTAFKTPITATNTVVIDTATVLGKVNDIMETKITPGLKPLIDINGPMREFNKVVEALEKEIHKLEHDMKKHVHIHVGPVNLKFTIHHLLKEWKIEVKKFEHLLNVDKLKKAMRHAVEKVVHKVVHAMEGFIHHLEHSVKVNGFNLGSLETAFAKLRTDLNFSSFKVDFKAYDLAIKDMSLGLSGLQSCK